MALRMRDFYNLSWILPAMIANMSPVAQKLKEIMRYVIALLIVQPEKLNPLTCDKKWLLILGANGFQT